MSDETPARPSAQENQEDQKWLPVKEYAAKYNVTASRVKYLRSVGGLTSRLVKHRPGPGGTVLLILDVPLETFEDIDENGCRWLPVGQYSEKYNISKFRIRGLRCAGRLIAKRSAVKGHKRTKPDFLILDVPLEEHPTLPQDIHGLEAPKRRGLPKKNLEKQRKQVLKEKYLPLFLKNAPDDRMVFSSIELQKILSIPPSTISRDWLRWGLIPRPVPEEFKHLSNVNVRGAFVYTRRDLVRFFNGEWEPPKKGTPDDILLGATQKDPLLEGQYYKYDPTKVYPLSATGFHQWLKEVDLQVENKRLRKWVSYKLWAVQREAVNEALKLSDSGDLQYKLAVFSAPRGEGKSFRKGTKIIYFDGSIGKIEDVKVGDLLMGPDSTPRNVLALGRGEEEMFKVTPLRGESFVCNRSHILALKYRKEIYVRREGKKSVKRYEIIDITVHLEDYLKQGPDFKSRCMLYRVPVDWPEKPVDVDPYYLGLWLSDENSNDLTITEDCEDVEIFDFLRGFTAQYNCELKLYQDKRTRALRGRITNGDSKRLRQAMEDYGLFNSKHIPLAYKANSREVRMRLLAGLLDGDGYRNRNSIQFTMKSRRLVDDIAFLARSLGFHAEIKETRKGIKSTGFVGTYYCLGISGDCSQIPNLVARKKCLPRKQVKNILHTGIKSVKSLGMGEYYGVVLDGDHLYLLEDFTVTHNTLLVCVLTLFFFFNGYSETITLAGNSKDQSKFTHYDLCKGIIQHTPALFKTPGLEIKEKHIALRTGPKEMFNYMQAIPSSVGLLPNTTRAVFTELHNLQDTKFFYDLWTSLRNVPNAMVVVDTTVARPGHLVHSLWQTYQKGVDPLIYFHHYSDKHYNPEMTEEALNHFRETLPDILFNMYFRNRWDDAAGSLFHIDKIRQIRMLEYDGELAPCPASNKALKDLMELEHLRNIRMRGGADFGGINKEIEAIERKIIPVDDLYKLPADKDTLRNIAKKYGCDRFIIGVGLDRAMRLSKHSGRTVLSCVARLVLSAEESRYFILDMFIPVESTLSALADKFMEWTMKFGWIDKVVVETYSSEDFYDWVSDKALSAEFVSPTYSRQKPVFFALDHIIESGRLKCPAVPYYTDEQAGLFRGFTNKDDIFRDELQKFSFVPGRTENTGTFGSSEKDKKTGTQDDTIYSVGWAIYATHGEDLIASGNRTNAGMISALVNKDVVGEYNS